MSDLAVITGASSGIGLAVAQRFLEAGCRVLSLSRRVCPARDAISLQLDLTSGDYESAINRWIEGNLTSPTRIVLIHNAAKSWHDRLADASAQNLRSMLELCVVAPQVLNKLFLHRMSEGSAILYVGSTLSTKAAPNAFSYVTAKHAIVGMMRATGQDLYGRAIHTACVCPGPTDTDMMRSLYDEKALDRIGKTTSALRLITPQEIAEVLYLTANNPVLKGSLIHANYGQLES